MTRISHLGPKVISVAIAVLLWGIVLGSRNIEVTKEIPLEILTPSDILISSDIPEKISFTLSGPKAFLRSVLDRKELPIRVNLQGTKPAVITYRFFADNIRVPIGVKVLGIHPVSIVMRLEYLKHKEIAVRAEMKGKPPEGYWVTKLEIKPERIRVSGPESVIESLTDLAPASIDVSQLKESAEKPILLDLPKNHLQLESALPKASITVEPLSLNFQIKNIDIHILTDLKSQIEEKNFTLLVQAESSEMQNLDRNQIFGIIDLRNKPKGRYLESLKVSLPNKMGLVKVIPDQATVTLY